MMPPTGHEMRGWQCMHGCVAGRMEWGQQTRIRDTTKNEVNGQLTSQLAQI